jgi:hypothetical protein
MSHIRRGRNSSLNKSDLEYRRCQTFVESGEKHPRDFPRTREKMYNAATAYWAGSQAILHFFLTVTYRALAHPIASVL